MINASDSELLAEFARNDSEAAFAILVQRYVGLVHSVALRHTTNPQQAQDITQAVFIVLARKGKTLGQRTILPGWLYQTARLTAANFQRAEARRIHREQEAFMQSTMGETTPDIWSELSPQLDAAMGCLGASERDALVLRFFQNKSMAEVGEFLGVAENTAQQRVGRALEKLRKFFIKKGITLSVGVIAGAISANSVHAAPVALANTTATLALAKGAAVSTSSLSLAKTTLIAMKTKTVVATIAAAVVLLGSGSFLVYQSQVGHASSASNNISPIQFANDAFSANGEINPHFLVEADPNTKRSSNAAPSIHIKSLNATPKSAQSSYLSYSVTNGSPYLGKHVRLTCWFKSSEVQGSASSYLAIIANKTGVAANDSNFDRSTTLGTTDWQQIEMVTDIPNEPCVIYLGSYLKGSGEIWADDFQLAVAPPNLPITDDRTWRHTSRDPDTYSKTTDFVNKHDGHAPICLTYTPDHAAPDGSWAWWGQMIRPPNINKYLGHTVRMTGWVKTENLSGRLQPAIRPWQKLAKGWKITVRDNMADDNSLRGTRDWTQFSVSCAVPQKTDHIEMSLVFWGSGKLWIDTKSLKYEIIK